ncbi:SHD1 domain-containing protein [Rubripirellula reticaptiva]|uniref:SLA1 homology domain-containing protein n=1 Tax=Rubripirellula reticaptiva TaxID=2528013 RepID=A0A5C6F9C1_9BACT|nr:SHD1 domain-containing protein [Rubripirellula reticaptiva]TWU56091.1 hypothetical protein Poly59_23950 [Rubripirellula reticaptiva]
MFRGLVIGFVCLLASTLATAEPPVRDSLTYANVPSGSITYVVTMQVGRGNGAEFYKGRLAYDVGDAGRWQVTGSLQRDFEAASKSGVPRQARPIGPLFTNSLLDLVSHASTRFEITSVGKVISTSSEEQIKLLLGDYLLWAIWPLGENGQSKWGSSEPILVQQISHDSRFPSSIRSSFGPNYPRSGMSMFDRERLSASIETTNYRITGTDGPITNIEQTYELKANSTDPPLTLSGKGSGKFDRRRGVFVELEWTREVVSNRSGAEVRLPVTISLKREMDFGLAPLTAKEKAAIARQKAEAESFAKTPEGKAKAAENEKRMAEERARRDKSLAEAKMRSETRKQEREAELSAPFDAADRKAWIATFDAGHEYGDGAQLYGKLNSKSDRNDPELGKAIYEFANRMGGGSLPTMFFDLAAKFDPDFAKVVTLRKAYANSHTSLDDMGTPLDSGNDLSKGQVVAVKQKHSDDYRAKFVVSADAEGFVIVQPIDSKPVGEGRIERVPASSVRLASPKVTKYLPADQRGTATATPERMTTAPMVKESSAELKLKTWMDKTGRYSITASFVSLEKDVVRLKKTDGTTIDIAIEKLSDPDAKAARDFAVDAANPFEVVQP